MRILKDNIAGICIDIQEKLFPHIHEKDKLLANCVKLIEGLKILEIPLLVTQQYSKGLGPTELVIMEKFPQFNFIEKISFSCCDEPVFMDRLRSLNKKYILLLGIETHVCVLQTGLDLLEHELIPVIVSDCTGSRKEIDKAIAIDRLRQEGAIITTSESILFELTRLAGNGTFKKISALIK